MREIVGLLYDAHVPYQDQCAYDSAVNYLKNLTPKLTKLIIGGDFVDFYKISFWKSDPNRMSFEQEVYIAREMLKDLRQKFPKIPIVYLEGNHEQRLFNHVRDNAPELLWNNNVENILHLGARNIKYVSNIANMCAGQQPYKIGKLFVLHGHEKKIGMNAVNLAKLFYQKCQANIIAGHHHHSDWTLVRKLNGTHEGAWTVGTLGQLVEGFQPINSWNHGFAWVEVFDDGFFEVHNKMIIEGRILNT